MNEDLRVSDYVVGGLFFVGLLVYATCFWNWPGSRRSDMPPGPPTLPILGNLLAMKPVNVYAQLRQLNEKYGPIASLKVGSGNVIVIGGDGSLVARLLDKRGAIYSGRPLQVATEIAAKGDFLLFQQDTDVWKASRKQMVQHYGPGPSRTEHFRVQEAESIQLLYDFMHKPEGYMQHPMRYTTSIITCLNYGIRCEEYDDPAVHNVEDIVGRLCELFTPGAKPPVEDLPWLGYLPNIMSPWKAKAKHVGRMMETLYEDLAEIAWDRGVSGQNTNTLAYKFRRNEYATKLTRRQQAFACGIALEGGSDIVAGAILSCILALVHDPASQGRAHEEIDSIYDEGTLPMWANEQSMPFIRAVVKEILRWRPPEPIGIPHRLEEDDSYDGYFLPKGSTVICNIWAIHSNSERYEDPETFKPERFLEHKMSAAESIAQGDPFKRDHFAFGAGRRSCPGVQMAEQGIFIALSRLLWAFEFSAPPSVTVNVDQSAWMGETVRHPKKFPLVIKLRSARRGETIDQEMATIKEDVYSQYGVYKNPAVSR